MHFTELTFYLNFVGKKKKHMKLIFFLTSKFLFKINTNI